jgi:hypothetical protein
MAMMPRPSDPNSQRAVAEFFGLKPDRFCRLLQRHAVDYKNRVGVAEMLRRSTSMSPTTRKAVDEVLKVDAPGAPSKAPETHLEALETMATLPPPKADTVEDAEQFLATLKRSMSTAERTCNELRQQGLFEDSRRWMALHSQLARQYPPLAKRINELKIETGDLVKLSAVTATLTAWAGMVRARLESMPALMAGRVNLVDPIHAQDQLVSWVESTCAWLHSDPLKAK